MTILIDDVTVFTNDEHNRVIENCAVAIVQNKIAEIDSREKLREKYPGFETIAGEGRLLMPGFINTHMHFYGTYARGLATGAVPQNFTEILSTLWWKLDCALDLDAIYYSALVAAISTVKNGVTSVVDHHASPNAVDGSLDRVEEALSQVGLRGVLCYEISDRDGKKIRDQGLRENERYIRKCQAAAGKKHDFSFDGMVGLHASFTLDDDSLEQAAQMSHALDRGCHIHMLEGETDEKKTQSKYHANVVDRLANKGILWKKTIAAHAICLDESSRERFLQTQAMVVHNPQSNMNNAVGRANVFDLLKHGVLVGIGTDGMTPDVKIDVRAGQLIHKHDLRNGNVGWGEIQRIFLKNNACIYEQISGQQLGEIAAGYLADVILLDYYPPTSFSGENFWGHFIFGIADAPVNTSIINGQVVMRDGKLPLDEREIAAKSRVCAHKVWQKFHKNGQCNHANW